MSETYYSPAESYTPGAEVKEGDVVIFEILVNDASSNVIINYDSGVLTNSLQNAQFIGSGATNPSWDIVNRLSNNQNETVLVAYQITAGGCGKLRFPHCPDE